MPVFRLDLDFKTSILYACFQTGFWTIKQAFDMPVFRLDLDHKTNI